MLGWSVCEKESECVRKRRYLAAGLLLSSIISDIFLLNR